MKKVLLISFVLTVCLFVLDGIQQGKITSQFMDDFYKEHIAEMLGGETQEGPRPEDTLVAPFSTKMAFETDTDLSKPHRRAVDVGVIAARVLSELFTFSSDQESYEEHLSAMKKEIQAGGLQDFTGFMETSGVYSSLQRNGTELKAFVEETPNLVKEGAFDGRYRWVFDVPVTVTELEKGIGS